MQDTGRRPSWFSSLFGRSGGGGGANPAHSAAAASGRSALTGAPANFTGVAANVPSLAADEAGGAGSDENPRKTSCLAEVCMRSNFKSNILDRWAAWLSVTYSTTLVSCLHQTDCWLCRN